MTDAILAIVIFHTLSALTLLVSFSISDCRSVLRLRTSKLGVTLPRPKETAAVAVLSAEVRDTDAVLTPMVARTA